MTFSFYDLLAFSAYCLLIIGVGGWLSFKNRKAGDAQSYFLADKSLSFWVIGCSIVAANISAEQFIGMSGSGYAIGLGIATYEWLAALILIVVAKFFLPVFIENQIYTMPEFLAKRYDNRIKNILAVFWLLLFVFVNLSSILYLGALALREIFNISLLTGILGLTIFSATYTILGGLKTIAKIDLIQIVFLVFGGLLTTYFALNKMSEGAGISKGFMILLKEVPEKFHLILKKGDPNFQYLPGIRAIFGGIWIAGIYYFGANQYIIQKALGAKNLKEAQRGMAFAGFIKLYEYPLR